MTEDELRVIEARAEAATPGPWEMEVDDPYVIWGPDDLRIVSFKGSTIIGFEDNAPFVAHAREDIPALIAEVRRLRKENDRLILGQLRDLIERKS